MSAGGAARPAGARHAGCEVAILGYGPVGATLANLLGAAGIDVVVIEREEGVHPLPRAIHCDGETMRVFRSLGLRERLDAVSRPGLEGMHFVNAEGRVLLVRAGTAAEGPHGCANNHYYHQPELEAVLREGVARFPRVRVLEGREATAIDADADGATLALRARDGTVSTLRAGWLVGCDGGRSPTRRAIGATMEDLGLHQPWLVFDAILERDGLGLPEHTVQRCDPARPMTLCNVTGRRRRWEIMLMPGDDPETIARPDSVWRLVEPWIGPGDARMERAVVYAFHSVIARGWRRGRLLLAGDSAHQTPPFLGQGLCAGIRDAANLAWKLARVARGAAPETLLDTYEAERRPHVHAFIELAVRLGAVIQVTDPAQAAERDRRFLAGETQVFEYPQPRLGPGLHAGPQGGTVFPQPRLGDGRPLDEAVGDAFAVVGDAATLDAAGPAARERDASAVVLRPDRYLLGAASDGAGLAALSGLLPGAA